MTARSPTRSGAGCRLRFSRSKLRPTGSSTWQARVYRVTVDGLRLPVGESWFGYRWADLVPERGVARLATATTFAAVTPSAPTDSFLNGFHDHLVTGRQGGVAGRFVDLELPGPQ